MQVYIRRVLPLYNRERIVMAWVAVDFYGTEWISENKPIRDNPDYFWTRQYWFFYLNKVRLPKGTIKKLIGKELSWKDKPIELK